MIVELTEQERMFILSLMASTNISLGQPNGLAVMMTASTLKQKLETEPPKDQPSNGNRQ